MGSAALETVVRGAAASGGGGGCVPNEGKHHTWEWASSCVRGRRRRVRQKLTTYVHLRGFPRLVACIVELRTSICKKGAPTKETPAQNGFSLANVWAISWGGGDDDDE